MEESISLLKAISFTVMIVVLELLLGFGAHALIDEINSVSHPAGLIIVLVLGILSMGSCLVGLIMTWIQYFRK